MVGVGVGDKVEWGGEENEYCWERGTVGMMAMMAGRGGGGAEMGLEAGRGEHCGGVGIEATGFQLLKIK